MLACLLSLRRLVVNWCGAGGARDKGKGEADALLSKPRTPAMRHASRPTAPPRRKPRSADVAALVQQMAQTARAEAKASLPGAAHVAAPRRQARHGFFWPVLHHRQIGLGLQMRIGVGKVCKQRIQIRAFSLRMQRHPKVSK